VTRYFREDLEKVSTKFKQFAHFSQFSGVSRDLKELPKDISVRVDSSPDTYIGEITFGVGEDGKLTWLQELVDSSG
jgi:hypothetical protein